MHPISCETNKWQKNHRFIILDENTTDTSSSKNLAEHGKEQTTSLEEGERVRGRERDWEREREGRRRVRGGRERLTEREIERN